MHKTTAIGLLLATMLLAGCGGGSSSSAYSGPTAAVAVTTTQEADVVAGYAASAATSSSMSTLTSNYTPLTGSSTAAISPSPATLGNLARRFADMAFKAESSTAAPLAGVTQSQTQACPGGGTVTITVSVSNPNATQPSAGDSVKFAFHNCAAAGYMTTGSIKFVIKTYTASSNFSASYSFSNFKETNIATGDYLKITGGYTAGITIGTDFTYSLTGNSIVFEASISGTVNQLRYSNFSFVDILYGTGDVSFDHDFTVASTEIGGSITVNTVTAFVIPAANTYPTSGQLVVTGANNAKVRLTAQPDGVNVFVEYDIVPVDGIYESNATVPWASL